VERRATATVLVAEDDQQLRQMYVCALESAGLFVRAVTNGVGALHAIAEELPSVIVLDLNMPCVDGWTVQRELGSRDSTRDIPIVVVSAEADLRLATLQVSAILHKPCVLDELVRTVEQHLTKAA
jgi:CheY-like chemotaxis protein